jgi:hypothetical protein
MNTTSPVMQPRVTKTDEYTRLTEKTISMDPAKMDEMVDMTSCLPPCDGRFQLLKMADKAAKSATRQLLLYVCSAFGSQIRTEALQGVLEWQYTKGGTPRVYIMLPEEEVLTEEEEEEEVVPPVPPVVDEYQKNYAKRVRRDLIHLDP